MFFLLRTAFWLSLLLLLIPADPSEVKSGARVITATDALGAAVTVYDDAKGFCGRNPTTCELGGAVADTYAAKLRTATRFLYDHLDSDPKEPKTTGSIPRLLPGPPAAKPAPAPTGALPRVTLAVARAASS